MTSNLSLLALSGQIILQSSVIFTHCQHKEIQDSYATAATTFNHQETLFKLVLKMFKNSRTEGNKNWLDNWLVMANTSSEYYSNQLIE